MGDRKRVVVTGIGFRSPIGNTIQDLTHSLYNNVSGIKSMPEWDGITGLRTKVAGNCSDIDDKQIIRKVRRTMGRVAILAALSAQDAVKDACLDEKELASPDCGVSFGSTEGSSSALEKFMLHISSEHNLRGIHSSSYLQIMSHTCAANLALMFQAKGPVIASCTACVSGSQGIGFGYEAIRAGRSKIMLTGGAEELHFMAAGIFDIMRATSTKYNEQPELTPKPFDRDRDGLVVSEGAACLVLEEYEHALKRNATVHAEIIGYGTNCDGVHLTNPSYEGMAGAMHRAINDAEISSEKIGHVNAHATATRFGDIAESNAMHSIFKDSVPVSGFKGYMGHTLGACGALESIISIIMMKEKVIFPTRNLENPDPECAPLNYIMNELQEKDFAFAMNNNFAFGGINTSLIFKLI